MKLYLVRHTRPDIEEGICYGQTDLGVADSFAQELVRVKKQIGEAKFDKVYSSSLKRCSTLASALFGDNFEIDSRLMELNFGDWELKKWDQISGEHWDRWCKDYIAIECPNGESFLQQHARVTEFLNDLRTKNYDSVAIVSHGGTIRSILATINNWDLYDIFKYQVEFGDVIKVNF